MESIDDRIAKLIKHPSMKLLPQLQLEEDCKCMEDSDMYGFSCANIDWNPKISENLLDTLKADISWNNPENISLMMAAYGIEDSFLSLTTGTDLEGSIHYLQLRKQQHKFFSNRLLIEARLSLEQKMVADSIQKLNDSLKFDEGNAAAYLLRAEAYFMLKDLMQAKKDLLNAMLIDSALTPEHEGLRKMYHEELQGCDSVIGKRKQPSQTNS
jgi:hypothetical protein